jgi:hypothetical protein
MADGLDGFLPLLSYLNLQHANTAALASNPQPTDGQPVSPLCHQARENRAVDHRKPS